MSTLGEKLKHELRELIPVTLFFFGTFQLLALTQALMLKQFGIHVSSFLAATVIALVVAKVVLIADHFSLVNRFSDKPLSYSVAWKTAIYFIASLVVRYIEHLSTSGDKQETLRRRTAGCSRKSLAAFLGRATLAAYPAAGLLHVSRIDSGGRPRAVIGMFFHDRRSRNTERVPNRP